MNLLAGDDELVHHLLFDYLCKVGIVVAALLVLAGGMVIIWKRSGRR
ncbi:hypothetical protein [Streptomyces griseocarneus]|nr:hypothetical protein [Streptomyces griseocarneus]MBZ6473664.1 hypothetical protein [Streptomyces griseocarneus]GHG64408.1 hypothetical protein GCM10018779_34300 [Streptomyces griseocarneus]